ncbi:putative bicarbonate transporter, IctB family [Oscillatoriales cyanobacterium LEGE 11467]|uniref:Bicarbonate transporter, IctB family n=1 Tax=Zarconia navalis LEGE 11467 TaxID=1828826 RepID=A0A928W0X8_9CYAN|nr:IctB family putative bicarbonate transporter [Zarconia navalis]MBE9041863.1 putative bicarbonate transporter, IctB family [Zarconia navalis LEGE 11467]
MTNLVWQQMTLRTLRPSRWRGSSFLYRLLGGSLRSWRPGSWLMLQSEPLGVALVALVFALAPFSSTSLVGVLMMACGAFWLLVTVSDDSNWGFTPIHVLLLAYWGIVTVATALSPVKAQAFSGWVKLTLFLLLFALCAKILRSPRWRSWVITIYLHAALVVSVYGMRQWYFGVEALATWTDPTSEMASVTRVYSYLGNPNLLAGYLIPAVVFSLAAIFSWRGWLPKALAVVMAIVNSACLVATFSRGGWIGLLAAGFAMVLLLVYWWSVKLPPKVRPWAMPAVLGASGLVLVAAVLFVEPVRMRVASIFVGREDSSNNFRLNVWAAVLDMIRARPVLGIGPGNDAFREIYVQFARAKYQDALGAYSVLLEILVEAGAIGLLSFLWLLLVTFDRGWVALQGLRNAASREGYWLMAAISTICGLMAHGLVDTVWYRPPVQTLWWLAVAIVASYYNPPEETSFSQNSPFSPFSEFEEDERLTISN